MVVRAVSAREWLTPLAVLVPILVTVIMLLLPAAVAPGTHGVCET